jgi:DNA-directed RNA polymerase II subunit RPB1
VLEDRQDVVTLKLHRLIEYNQKPKERTQAESARQQRLADGYVAAVQDRVPGKHGRIRGNMHSKRVDDSGRMVIGPNPSIRLGEVSVPLEFADQLMVEERACDYNLAALQALVDRGRAISVVFPRQGIRPWVEGCAIKIEVGCVVNRRLRTGDVVLINRQPSLHKQSMMAHRVVVVPGGHTLGLNLAATSPYNADFDGDEMNLMVPQGIKARAEAAQLMSVHKNIMSGQSSKPVIGLVQDALLGCYRLTSDHVYLTRADIGQLAVRAGVCLSAIPPPAVSTPTELWTGRQAASMALPKGLDTGRVDDWHSATVVGKGGLLSGRFDKRAVGAVDRSLVHLACLQVGSEACADMIDALQSIAGAYMEDDGFRYAFVGSVLLNAGMCTDVLILHAQLLPRGCPPAAAAAPSSNQARRRRRKRRRTRDHRATRPREGADGAGLSRLDQREPTVGDGPSREQGFR